MENSLAFQKTFDNLVVIMGVVMVAAGPLVGLIGTRLYDAMRETGLRFNPVMLWMAIFAIFAFPGVMLSILLTNPKLSLVDHREQAILSLEIGYLVPFVGVIALVLDSRFRRAKGDR